jgi:Ca2+-binding RTX toxin-like protein
MKTLQWVGSFQTVVMIDLVRPNDPEDDVKQSFTGHANSSFWQGDPGGSRLLGTGDSDLVFLDDKALNGPRLENIDVFSMLGGNDVVDLRPGRFTYGDVKLVGGNGDDWLYGNTGDDEIHGGNGADRLKGFSGSDTITGGNGDDEMFGGARSDTFIIDAKDGSDNVYDFVTSGKQHDLVDVSQTGIKDFDELLKSHAVMENGELKITFNDGNYLRLYGLDITDLRADDFVF